VTITDPILTPGTAFARTVTAVRDGADLDAAVDALLGQLTDDELLGLLDGDVPLWRGLPAMAKRYNATPYEAGRVDRLGIPGIRFTDGPRGVVMGASTCFPVAIARAASWDTGLERRVGDAIGAEARAQGANLFAGICVNLAYAPGWGRSQESYGEDPLLLAAMGSALVEGARPWVMTCVKHYALNSMEEARFTVDVRVSEDVLHEAYLPHFRRTVEAGADAVMSSYNSVNGEWAGQNRHLLTDILRDEWGFRGFVMTDFVWGLRAPVESVAAGQDLEMPFAQQRAAALPQALARGQLQHSDVLRAVHRLLAAQVRLALRARPTPPISVVASPRHRALAHEAAVRGTVLLRNVEADGQPVLPLAHDATLAVLGPLADEANEGDVGSSAVHPPASVSVLDGLRERLGGGVTRVPASDVPGSVAAARAADAALVVVGLTSRDEGESITAGDAEAIGLLGRVGRSPLGRRVIAAVMARTARRMQAGGDREDLHLHADDVRLIELVAAANPHTVVVVVAGGTIMLDPWDQHVAGILLAWYPGMEGGRALADVLLGDAEPGGRLPFTIPRRRTDLPVVDWQASSVPYTGNWGQRRLDRAGVSAAYPLGFGLGYTSMRLTDLQILSRVDEDVVAEVTVTNTGQRPGRHVVQLYASQSGNRVADVPVLIGFSTVTVGPGESSTVQVRACLRPLQQWNGHELVLPEGRIEIAAGSFAGDPDRLVATLQ
jgi:beta-glucosidase